MIKMSIESQKIIKETVSLKKLLKMSKKDYTDLLWNQGDLKKTDPDPQQCFSKSKCR